MVREGSGNHPPAAFELKEEQSQESHLSLQTAKGLLEAQLKKRAGGTTQFTILEAQSKA